MESTRMQSFRDQMQRFKELSPFSSIIDDVTHREYMMLKMIDCGIKGSNQDQSGAKPVGIKTTTLSELLYISKPAVSQMLNALENKGLIQRIMTKRDRRVVYVILTPEGAEKYASVQKRFDNFIEKVFQRMGQEDTDQFLYLLDKLSAATEAVKNETADC